MARSARVDGANVQNRGASDQLKSLYDDNLIHTGPSYGNNFFFTIGVYLIELFVVLGATGLIMVLFGPYWWDMSAAGTFVRSVHLWAAEAFVTLMFVHLFVNFCTSAFRKKRLVWIIGGMMFAAVLFEFAFGVGIGGSLVSQANQQAGSDLWNGMGLGFWINPMNSGAVFGWHVAIVPLLLVVLILSHYSLVRKAGLNTPYRKDIPYSIVPINHRTLYKRMAYVLVVVVLLALLFSAPYIPPLTIGEAAQAHPDTVAMTFLKEFNGSSATATYLDTIDPYSFNTSSAYVSVPYSVYLNLTHSQNEEARFLAENRSDRSRTLAQAYAYFDANGTVSKGMNSSNPMIVMASSLTYMAQVGAYQPVLQGEVMSGNNDTYVIRFLYDSGILWAEASRYGLSVPQWGMLKVGAPPWSLQYWLIPYNLLQIQTANIPWWNDVENGSIGAVTLLILVFLPYIPGLREVPDRLRLYKLFWNKYTIPDMKNAKRKRGR